MGFNHIGHPDLPEVVLHDGPDGRYYLSDGKQYPSVTQVLRILSMDGLANYRERTIQAMGRQDGEEYMTMKQRVSLRVGSEMHDMLEKFIRDDVETAPPGVFDMSRALFLKMKQFLLGSITDVVAVEEKLVSRTWEVAGTVDLIARYEGTMSIIDFKNSVKYKDEEYIQSYFQQATWYSLIWEELTGHRIDQIVILIATWDGKIYPWVKDRSAYITDLAETVARWRTQNAA